MKSSLSLILIFFIGYLQAQDSNKNDIEKLIESSYLNQDNEIDYSELQAQQKNFKKANLNKIGAIEFHSMNILNFNLIEEILLHQKQYGPLKTKYELQTIDGIDSNAIIALCNAFEINNFSFQLLISQKHQEFIRLKYSYRLEKALGFKLNDSNKFIGNRSKIGFLYNSESINLDYGLHIEKDAGETEKMLFQSAYVFIKPKRIIQSILIGDQQINFAQGLSLGTGLTNGKSALVMQIMRNNVGCKPYKSFNETGFMRGLSIKKKFVRNMEFDFFAGIRQLDATIRNDSNGYEYGGIINSGYYRNKKEQNSRHQLIQYLSGYHGLYKYHNLEIGSSLILHKIDLNPFNKNKAFETNKITGIKIGIDWKLHLRNNLVFGEITINNVFKKSLVMGLLRTLGKKTDLSLLYRRYTQNDDSKLSNGFGNTNTCENGFYLGISTQLPSKFNLSLYNDLNQFKHPKFRVDAPSFQSEQMIEIAYKTKNPFSIYFRYKHTERKQNSPNMETINSLDQHHKTVYRLHTEVTFEKIKIRTRLEFVKYAIENQRQSIGNLLYQDIQFNSNKGIDMTIRYSIFSSDDFNSRTFAYENDVPGTFNIPSYIGKGSRMYVLIKYQIQKDLQIWFRFARSSYVGTETNGSGLNLIESPHASDLNIQLQWKF